MPDGTAAWEAAGGAQTQPVLPDAAAQQSHDAPAAEEQRGREPGWTVAAGGWRRTSGTNNLTDRHTPSRADLLYLDCQI